MKLDTELTDAETHLLGFGLSYFRRAMTAEADGLMDARSAVFNLEVAGQVDVLLTKLDLTDYLDNEDNLARVTEQIRRDLEDGNRG